MEISEIVSVEDAKTPRDNFSSNMNERLDLELGGRNTKRLEEDLKNTSNNLQRKESNNKMIASHHDHEINDGVTINDLRIPKALMERITKRKSSNLLTKLVTHQLIREYLETSEYEIRFKLFRFIKMFVTTVSFFLFGIITTLFIVLIDGYGFAWNQFFIGTTDLMFIITNYLDNLITVSIMIVYYILSPVHVQMI